MTCFDRGGTASEIHNYLWTSDRIKLFSWGLDQKDLQNMTQICISRSLIGQFRHAKKNGVQLSLQCIVGLLEGTYF